MARNFLLLSAFFFCFSFAFGQSYTISGRVTDNSSAGVPYASIALSKTSDTSVVQFAVAQDDGSFVMKEVKAGEYYFVVACVGYDVMHYPITVFENKNDIVLELPSGTLSMSEVLVRARSIPILMNGDTVVYNSSSFKTQSNASVEDLIKKMPGIQVNKDGTVAAEGQAITKVLINGKEFFGGNVQAATKNLDAGLVDKVEVVDRKSDDDEFSGNDNNQREKVINLVLKKETNRGYFGTLRGGYGTDDYYDASGNINFFQDATQLSIIGGLNNINRDLYGWREMSTLNSFEIRPFNGDNMSWNWNTGIKTNKGVGANLHFEPVKGMKADIAYVVSDVQTLQQSTNNSEVYLTNNTLFSETETDGLGIKDNHQINTKIEYEPDTLNRIVFRGQFSKMINDGFTENRTANFYTEQDIINSGVNRTDVNEGNDNFATKLHWTKKNRKNTDNYLLASLYVGGANNTSDVSTYFNTVSGYLLPKPTTENPKLQKLLTTQESTIATTTGYQIKLNDKWGIRPGFNWMQSDYSHDFTWIPEGEEILTSNSPKGTVKARNMEYYMHISYKVDSFTTLYIVPELNQSIETRSFTTDKLYTYDFNQFFFIPYMFIRSNKPHKYNFHFNLRAQLQRPQVSQVLPVTDNSNPYSTTIGNIELQNNMNYNNAWSYRRMFGLGKSISLNGWNSYTINPVTNSNRITEDNYSISEVLNYKNRIYSNTGFEVAWPIKAIKAQMEFDIDYNFNQAYFIQNGSELLSKNNGIAAGPSIAFNEFDMWSLDADYMLNYKVGSIGGRTNNAFVYHEIDLEFVFTPIDRIEFSNTLYWEIYGSNSAVGAISIPILSSELSVFIDKSQKWSVGAKAFDIFNKNQNLWRWWSNNSFTQNQNIAVQRYIMGTLTYKINTPAGRDQNSSEHRRHW
jgi:hypothetical protein